MCVEPLRKSYSGPMTFNSNFHQRHCHLAIWGDILVFFEAMIRVKEMLKCTDQQMKLGNCKEVWWRGISKVKKNKQTLIISKLLSFIISLRKISVKLYHMKSKLKKEEASLSPKCSKWTHWGVSLMLWEPQIFASVCFSQNKENFVYITCKSFKVAQLVT